MGDQSLSEFLKETADPSKENGKIFQLENSQCLAVKLDGFVWAKLGTMVGYTGKIKFSKQGMSEQGVVKLVKKSVTGEGISLMKCEGKGKLLLADNGRKVEILELKDQTIFANGQDVLALEDTLKYSITMMKSVAGMWGGGLFSVKIKGKGLVALCTEGIPMTIQVAPNNPLSTDANCTVAWSESLEVSMKTDLNIKSFLGHGSGEGLQMHFSGTGWVVLQPSQGPQVGVRL